MKRHLVIIISCLVLAVLTFVWYFTRTSDTTDAPMAYPAVEPHPAEPVVVVPKDVAQPVQSDLDRVLAQLRDSYAGNSSTAVRIRLEGWLDAEWGRRPPAEVLLAQINDPTAPDAYRLHFAERLRNLAVLRDPWTRAELAEELRDVIETAELSDALRVSLQRELLFFDQSDESVGIIVAQATQAETDAEAAQFIRVLREASNPIARDFVWAFAREHAATPDVRATALAEAVPPLSREPSLPVEPVFAQIVAASSNASLIELVVKESRHRAVSPASVGLVLAARDRAQELPPLEAERILTVSRSVLQRMYPSIQDNPELFDAATLSRVERILEPENESL